MGYPSVTIDGEVLSTGRLVSVSVSQVLNEHWWAVMTCTQTEDSPIPVEDWLGDELTVTSLDSLGATQQHFAGFVLSVNLVYESSGTYTAQVTAVSQTWLLDQAMRKQYYAEQGLAAVAGQIADRAGLLVSVQVPDGKPLNYVQYGETDFNLLHRIVDDHNAWLRPSQDGLEIFNAFQPGTELVCRGESGLGLLHFDLAGTLNCPSFDGSHYDFHTMTSQNFSKVSKPAEFYPSQSGMAQSVQQNSNAVMPSGFAQQRARVMSLEEYRQSLEDESERSIGSAVTGNGTSRNQSLMAGNTVQISGALSDAGTYGLTRVAHRWTAAGYLNDFVCTPWKQFRNAEEPTLRSWNGVVPARVVDHNDPGKMGRIKVQFFWQDDGATHWARATSPHAGPDRGFMFLPEIGDEVAVAFEDGDPERPIILGSMWNGVQQAPRYDLRGDDVGDNDVKRLITKAGNRFQASDKAGKETVVLATPNKTKLHMTEKHDSTKRPMVTLHSKGDIFLSAPNGRVHINSLYFSRDVGPLAGAKAGGGAAAAPTRNGADNRGPAVDCKGNPRLRNNLHFSPESIAAAQAAQKKHGIPASVTLAQYAQESSAGKHMPIGSNNPFGIKAVGDQPYVTAWTQEVVDGKLVRVQQNFRKYDSIDDAFDDHGRLLAQSKHYAKARKSLPDPDAFADALGGVYAPNIPGKCTYGENLRYQMDDQNLRAFNEVK